MRIFSNDPITKESQRSELHKIICHIPNDPDGSIGGRDFESYLLGMLFYRFISENLTAYINAGEHKAGQVNFDYVKHTYRLDGQSGCRR